MKGLSQKNTGTKSSACMVLQKTHIRVSHFISLLGCQKVEPEIDISNVTSNEIDDKCTFKILCVNFFRITYAAVLRVKHLTITSTNNYIGYCINYLQVGFFYLIH